MASKNQSPYGDPWDKQLTRAITPMDIVDIPPACSFGYGRINRINIIRSGDWDRPAPIRRPKRKHKNKKRRR